MALEDEMNNLTGPTDLEKAGMVVEIVSGKDQESAGALPPEGQQGTRGPVQTDENVIPVEGITPTQAPETVEKVQAVEAPVQQPVDQPDTVDQTTPQPMPDLAPVQVESSVDVTGATSVFASTVKSIIASASADVVNALTDENGAVDPLRIPDPYKPENGQTLYNMFFRHEDPQVKSRIDSAITTAVGFVAEGDINDPNAVSEDDVVFFSGDQLSIDSINDRVRYMVANGGTRLVYPAMGDDAQPAYDAEGRQLYNASTTVPVLAELELYRRESITDITLDVPFTDSDITLLDLPRADLTPEGQAQLDNFLQAIGMTPYERTLINRAEFSGYLPAQTSGGLAKDAPNFVRNSILIGTGQQMQGLYGALAEFAGMRDGGVPDYVVGEDGKVQMVPGTAPTEEYEIPYAPTFAQEIAERLAISESDAEALVGYTGDASTRFMRIGREGFPILVSLLYGRSLRDKKQMDRFIEWMKKEFKTDDEAQLLSKVVESGKTLDGVVGEYVRTQVRAPLRILKGFSERGAVKSLQRATSPFKRISPEAARGYRQKEIDQISNVIDATRKRLDKISPDQRGARTEAVALTKRIADLQAKRQKLINKGIKDLLPETIKQLATEEGLALTSSTIGGQAWQQLFNDSSTYLDDNGMWAEAFFGIVGSVGLPLFGKGMYATGKGAILKTGELLDYAITGITPDLERKITTGDARIDRRLDEMYRGIKSADPEFQRYILDQFDYIRGIRDDLINAKDRDGNTLIDPRSVQLTFSMMSGLVLFDAYSNYIIRNVADAELADVSSQLLEIETMLRDTMKANDDLSRVVRKLSGAAIEDPQIAPITKTLDSFVKGNRKTIEQKLSATQGAIRQQADIAKQMLKGQPVATVDPETGDTRVVNFEEIFTAEENAIVEIGLRQGEDLDTILATLRESAQETYRLYYEGLSVGQDIFTANGGSASRKFFDSFFYKRGVKYREIGELFGQLRGKYPNVYADGRFLIDDLKGTSPELLAALGSEMSYGIKELGGLGLNGKVRRGATKALSESFGRFEKQLVEEYNVDPMALETLYDAAGRADNGLSQFIKLDSFLRRKALDEDASEFAVSLFGEGAKPEDLIALADNMTLPVNFAEAHVIASSLGKLASKYEGTPNAIALAVLREKFLDQLRGDTYGFRDAAGALVTKQVMEEYDEVRRIAKEEYYDRFFSPNSFPMKFARGVRGSADNMLTMDVPVGQEPSKVLGQLFDTVPGFKSRPLDSAVDRQELSELESKLAQVFGKKDPVSGEYYIDLDSQEAKELGRILQTAAAEELIKSKFGKELIERAKGSGDFDIIREVLRLAKDPEGEYNPNIINNIGKISGRRTLPDGTLSEPQPILAEVDVLRAVDIHRLRNTDEETQALTNGAVVEIQKRMARLSDSASNEAKEIERDINSFERLARIVTGGETGDSGRQVHAMMRTNPENLDRVRDAFMQQAVLDGDAENFAEAGEMFDKAIRYQLGQYISSNFIEYTGKSVFGEPMSKIKDPAGLARLLGIDDPAMEAQMRQVFGDEHYNSLRNVAEFYAGRAIPEVPVKFRVPTDLTPEALYSRLNNINRGVAGVRWSITEFLLRSMRRNKSNVLQLMFSRPEVADAFEALILQNKEITPSMMAKLEDNLYSALSQTMFTRATIGSQGDVISEDVTPDEEYRAQMERMGLIQITPEGNITRDVSQGIMP